MAGSRRSVRDILPSDTSGRNPDSRLNESNATVCPDLVQAACARSWAPPTIDEMRALTQKQRRALLLELTAIVQQVAATQSALAGLLAIESEEPLWNTEQATVATPEAH